MLTFEEVTERFRVLQSIICEALEEVDCTGLFSREDWQHAAGGGGLTRIITSGTVFEKGGVNFSSVTGRMPAFMRAENGMADETFRATGVSLVLHPYNPFVPIVHMNVRHFRTASGLWWFGGGTDLTPIYVNEQDARAFHAVLRSVCDEFDELYYPRFAKWADDYFYLSHRNETRGVGGIFFDRLTAEPSHTMEDIFAFVMAVGNAFVRAYLPIVTNRDREPFSEQNSYWQRLRRGRYAEFNLALDRGTRFGLETGGRTESILMSLPPTAAWEYDYRPAPKSPEANTLSLLRKGVVWA